MVKYVYDAWGNCLTTVLDIHATGIANLNPFRYRGYYYDVETKLYFLQTRYYDPEIGRFITIDDISYLDPDSINGLNLYAYCGNNPVMGYDPNGTTDCEDDWDWSPLLTLAVAMGVVVGVTAVTATGVGVVAYALGASAATISAITTTAAIGGIVAGSIEIGIQVAENGLSGMDLGSIAIESFTGTVYGAITGASILTTSIPLKLGLRGARAVLSGVNAALHSIYNGDSLETISHNTHIAIGSGLLIQGGLALADFWGSKIANRNVTNKLFFEKRFPNATRSIKNAIKVIKNSSFYSMSVAIVNDPTIRMIGILLGKSFWRNRELFIGGN